MQTKIAPSILSANFANLEADVKRLEKAGIDMIHVDVMDGHFVPNMTIGPVVISSLRRVTDLFFDVHLMISHPDRYIESFATAGSDGITVHVECESPLGDTLALIKKAGKKVGLAINPDTDLKKVYPFLPQLDMVLVMTVFPGFAGQSFIAEALEKVRELRNGITQNKVAQDLLIQVDGGINADTIRVAREAGANVFVAGNFIFKNDKIEDNILRLRQALS